MQHPPSHKAPRLERPTPADRLVTVIRDCISALKRYGDKGQARDVLAAELESLRKVVPLNAAPPDKSHAALRDEFKRIRAVQSDMRKPHHVVAVISNSVAALKRHGHADRVKRVLMGEMRDIRIETYYMRDRHAELHSPAAQKAS